MRKKVLDVIRKGKKIETSHFIWYIGKSENLKIGFLLNRLCGNSVSRNRLKRFLRLLIRENFTTGDFVIKVKSECADLEKEEIKKEWNDFLRQIF